MHDLEREANTILEEQGLRDRKLKCLELRPYRSRVFRGDLADFVLEHGGSEVVFAQKQSSLSQQAVELLQEYKARYFPKMQWILWDDEGNYKFELDGKSGSGVNPALRSQNSSSHKEKKPSLHSFFSPNNQWLLKVLSLYKAEPELWGGPKEKIFSVGELVNHAGTSVGACSKFISSGKELGFIGQSASDGSFVILRHQKLLESWSQALPFRDKDYRSLYVSCLYGSSRETLLKRMLDVTKNGEDRVVLGGFLSLAKMELYLSNAGQFECYFHGELSRFFENGDLIESEQPNKESVHLKIPKNPKPIFDAAGIIDGVSVSDPLQSYLDLRQSIPRGEEQSELLHERILTRFGF